MSNSHLKDGRFRRRDLTDQKFGRLTALRVGSHKRFPNRTEIRWVCLCECGNRSLVLTGALLQGRTLSCGCLQRERTSAARTTHGGTRKGSRDRLYTVWVCIKARCLNPNSEAYKDYGGRGISICERWLAYENFKADMSGSWKEGLTIERRDNDGPYSPENCFWADRTVQANNRRSNLLLTLEGVTLTAAQWAVRLGWLHALTIYVRKQRGWSDQQTLTERPRRQKNSRLK